MYRPNVLLNAKISSVLAGLTTMLDSLDALLHVLSDNLSLGVRLRNADRLTKDPYKSNELEYPTYCPLKTP